MPLAFNTLMNVSSQREAYMRLPKHFLEKQPIGAYKAIRRALKSDLGSYKALHRV